MQWSYTDMTSGGDGDNMTSLICDEVLHSVEGTPVRKDRCPDLAHTLDEAYAACLPPTVKAAEDKGLEGDDRVLQNLLRNEARTIPGPGDFLRNVQGGELTAGMRRVVAEWMLEVVHEQRSQPEVFALAVNLMDRFLCICQVAKQQLQLVGSVCILVASKMRETCPIPGQTLIAYTDYSITQEELKDWEQLILAKLRWEVCAVTALDYLDHVLPRLRPAPGVGHLPGNEPGGELRRRAETILVVAFTDYRFARTSPSMLAAAAVLVAVNSMLAAVASEDAGRGIQDIRLQLQTITHTEKEHLEQCSEAIRQILPDYLRDASAAAPTLDDDDINEGDEVYEEEEDVAMVTPIKSALSSPEVDLACRESLASESILVADSAEEEEEEEEAAARGEGREQEFRFRPPPFFTSAEALAAATPLPPSTTSSSSSTRPSSPLSAVDIFTEFNTNVLRAVFEQAEGNNSGGGVEGPYSILVS